MSKCPAPDTRSISMSVSSKKRKCQCKKDYCKKCHKLKREGTDTPSIGPQGPLVKKCHGNLPCASDCTRDCRFWTPDGKDGKMGISSSPTMVNRPRIQRAVKRICGCEPCLCDPCVAKFQAQRSIVTVNCACQTCVCKDCLAKMQKKPPHIDAACCCATCACPDCVAKAKALEKASKETLSKSKPFGCHCIDCPCYVCDDVKFEFRIKQEQAPPPVPSMTKSGKPCRGICSSKSRTKYM